MFRKRIAALVGLLALAMTLWMLPAHATNPAPAFYAGWQAFISGSQPYIDQATATWDVSCQNSTTHTSGCTRWVGTIGAGTSNLWQGGEWQDFDADGDSETWFFVEANGPCASVMNGGNPMLLGVLIPGQRMGVHIYANMTSFDAYFSINGGACTEYGPWSCSSAYAYRGTHADFFVERPGDGTCSGVDALGTFTSNDILGPEVHFVGESASTLHYLSNLSPNQASPMTQQNDGTGTVLASSGSLGSNSDFLLTFSHNGVPGC